MTGDERRLKEKELRLEMLLDISQKLIFDRGFENVNINDIADASGYTRRSIYLYFRDRDEIFFHIVRRGQQLLLETLKEAETQHLSGGSAVDFFCDAIFNFAEEHKQYFELILSYELRKHDYRIGYSDQDNIKSVCQNLSVDYGEIVSSAIERDLQAGRLKTKLTGRQLMLIFWGQVFGFMQIIIQRPVNFTGVYGIKRSQLLEEFKTIIGKIYS